jgi:hypothetical protein
MSAQAGALRDSFQDVLANRPTEASSATGTREFVDGSESIGAVAQEQPFQAPAAINIPRVTVAAAVSPAVNDRALPEQSPTGREDSVRIDDQQSGVMNFEDLRPLANATSAINSSPATVTDSSGQSPVESGQPGGQENRLRTSDEIPALSAGAVNLHAAAPLLKLPEQIVASRKAPEIAAPNDSAKPERTASPIAPQNESVSGKPSTAEASSAKSEGQPGSAVPAAEEAWMQPLELPAAAAPADNGDGGQPLSDPAKKDLVSGPGNANPALANAADPGTGNNTPSASAPGDPSSHDSQGGSQNGLQSSASMAADASRTADAAPRAADSGATQTLAQTVTAQAAVPESPPPHRTPDVAVPATRSTGQQDAQAPMHADSGEAVAASSINSAKLLQTINQSEMHVGMRSTEFGDISIRTSITQQQMVTQISLDHNDLSQAISAHVSTMQTKLGEDYGIHASIEVHNMGSPHSGEPGQSSQREQRTLAPSQAASNAPFTAEDDAGAMVGALAVAGNGNRLDIRA